MLDPPVLGIALQEGSAGAGGEVSIGGAVNDDACAHEGAAGLVHHECSGHRIILQPRPLGDRPEQEVGAGLARHLEQDLRGSTRIAGVATGRVEALPVNPQFSGADIEELRDQLIEHRPTGSIAVVWDARDDAAQPPLHLYQQHPRSKARCGHCSAHACGTTAADEDVVVVGPWNGISQPDLLHQSTIPASSACAQGLSSADSP